jgi:GAF domain-containing protein
MVENFDMIEFLHHLAERCVELLDCAEAGLLLADAGGVLRVMASSSERSDALDLLQSQNEEGPCFESYQRGTPIFSEDLTEDAERWPTFAPMTLQKGFRSVQAIPMRVRGEAVGALNLFRATTGRLIKQDLSLAQGWLI